MDGNESIDMDEGKAAKAIADMNQNIIIYAKKYRLQQHDHCNDQVTDEEVDEMIRMVDKDGDGQASLITST